MGREAYDHPSTKCAHFSRRLQSELDFAPSATGKNVSNVSDNESNLRARPNLTMAASPDGAWGEVLPFGMTHGLRCTTRLNPQLRSPGLKSSARLCDCENECLCSGSLASSLKTQACGMRAKHDIFRRKSFVKRSCVPSSLNRIFVAMECSSFT